MASALTTILLPVALGIIMFGLGLTLTLSDFARVGKHPKAVIIALVCQLLVLPAICFGLVLAFQLPPVLAVGMLLLAASPGGTTANLYSHLLSVLKQHETCLIWGETSAQARLKTRTPAY